MGAFITALVIIVVCSIVFLSIFAYGAISWGVVCYNMWNWFMVGHFALSPITFVQALAINAVIALFATRCYVPKKDDFGNGEVMNWKDTLTDPRIWYFVFAPWVTLLFAWILKLFIC